MDSNEICEKKLFSKFMNKWLPGYFDMDFTLTGLASEQLFPVG